MSETRDRNKAVWEQLLCLAESGDLRAIKLYYDMLEKKERQQKAVCRENDREMEQMAAIRQAVFGDDAVLKEGTGESDEEADVL